MKRLKNLLKKPEANILLFVLAFLLLGWPFLTPFGQGYGEAIFVYLFFIWGIIIFGLYLINRSLRDEDPQKDEAAEKE